MAREKKKKLITIVTPAYNEEANLSLLRDQLGQCFAEGTVDWEWVIVDDHSADRTFELGRELADQDGRIRVFRLARNFGSHAAIRCGLDHARGHAAIVMAADLQDDPQLISRLIEKWRAGSHVVWAAREIKEGAPTRLSLFSRFYYWIMRRVVGLYEMPENGADFFLVDRVVVKVVRRFSETNVSIFALISWVGFKQTSIFYGKRERVHGKSGWSLEKKIKLLIDSITSFSYFPIRLMSFLGLVVAALGFLYASYIVLEFARGTRPAGWSSMMVVLLVVGGMQMLMLGILGEYVWRALDESRHRPRYIVEAEHDPEEEV